ncbi:PspC domain-containing protein [Lactobacillus sp. S2-2]|uniref:PspC domain-containing protein n=1 Tax=Lactobacillus sp. S2-2 TaxID=2692917 RepID=UPI001F385E27|nr:PspC domain-containing protein [Lactobacillus sp. S2-2]MCF6515685.1 PspC domain-containing protein [Lactobacillus sp. S2-2]
MKKKLYRSSQNRIIAGVFGGLGEYFNLSAFWLRIIFLVLIVLPIFTMPIAILFYILMVIIVPTKETESFYQYFKNDGSNNNEKKKEDIKDGRKILHDVEEHDTKK